MMTSPQGGRIVFSELSFDYVEAFQTSWQGFKKLACPTGHDGNVAGDNPDGEDGEKPAGANAAGRKKGGGKAAVSADDQPGAKKSSSWKFWWWQT